MRWIFILLLLPAVFAADLADINGYRVPTGVDDLFGNAVVTVQLTDTSATYKLAEKQILVSEEAADYIVTLNIASTDLQGNIVPTLTTLYADGGITVEPQSVWSNIRFWWASKWFSAPTEAFELPIEEIEVVEVVEVIEEVEEEQTLTEMVEAVEEEVEEVEEVIEEPQNPQISIEGLSFEPNEITISVGETIDFNNNREAGRWEKAHLMGVREIRDAESEDFYPGESWSYTFTEAGRFQMVDMYITTMVMTIVVEE